MSSEEYLERRREASRRHYWANVELYKIWHKEWRERNPTYFSEWHKKDRLENPDKCKGQDKKSRERNKVNRKAYDKKWCAENPEHIKAYHKKWWVENRERLLEPRRTYAKKHYALNRIEILAKKKIKRDERQMSKVKRLGIWIKKRLTSYSKKAKLKNKGVGHE